MIGDIEMSIQKRAKKPSKALIALFDQAAGALVSFAQLWKKIQDKGEKEGFSNQELQDMFRPYLRKRLTPSQIKYLYDPEYYKDKSKEQYSERKTANISQQDSNNVLDWIFAEPEEGENTRDIHVLIENDQARFMRMPKGVKMEFPQGPRCFDSDDLGEIFQETVDRMKREGHKKYEIFMRLHKGESKQ